MAYYKVFVSMMFLCLAKQESFGPRYMPEIRVESWDALHS